MSLPKVALKRVANIRNYEEIRDGVAWLLEKLGGELNIANNGTVLIKVNLCLLMGPETGATVDPRVARAIVEWLKTNHKPKQVIIAEADATHLSASTAFKALGWENYFRESKLEVEFLNLSIDNRMQAKTCYGRFIEMSEKYMKADVFISLAKLKTHSAQKISCTMKNLFGALPEKYKAKYHHRLAEAICEFSSARPPDISFVDGLVGMDGKGPVNGFPRICRLLIAGTDMVATDYFCAKIMGFRPKSIPHITKAIKIGLGSEKYNLVGDVLEEKTLNFKLMPLWEELFRNFVKGIRRKREPKTSRELANDMTEV